MLINDVLLKPLKNIEENNKSQRRGRLSVDKDKKVVLDKDKCKYDLINL